MHFVRLIIRSLFKSGITNCSPAVFCAPHITADIVVTASLERCIAVRTFCICVFKFDIPLHTRLSGYKCEKKLTVNVHV